MSDKRLQRPYIPAVLAYHPTVTPDGRWLSITCEAGEFMNTEHAADFMSLAFQFITISTQVRMAALLEGKRQKEILGPLDGVLLGLTKALADQAERWGLASFPPSSFYQTVKEITMTYEDAIRRALGGDEGPLQLLVAQPTVNWEASIAGALQFAGRGHRKINAEKIDVLGKITHEVHPGKQRQDWLITGRLVVQRLEPLAERYPKWVPSMLHDLGAALAAHNRTGIKDLLYYSRKQYEDTHR